MEGMIRTIMELLAFLVGLYSLLIIIRIILTWFGNADYGKPMEFLARITDPYLDWWRKKLNLRAGLMDLSPLVAIAVLSIVQTICSTIAKYGKISLGIILAVCVSALWSAVSFILGFCFVVLLLRLIAYFLNSNMYSTFWSVIDSISRPLLYRINRIIFGNRIVKCLTGNIVAIIVVVVLWILGRTLIGLLFGILTGSSV
jgi:YggT family protein